MPKVFLGGTCNGSTWRNELIPMLKINYFNPVVENWTPECLLEEIEQRETCDYCLYVITPKMTGVYSIAEVVDDSNKRPKKTILCVLYNHENVEFEKFQKLSLSNLEHLVAANGCKVLNSIQEVADYLNA